ncbi:amino acid ABC transporter substrate-binding protein [Pseudomonas sp. HMWF032]|uniref:substrate-binding periplasmic protein n=1 Tax=unclassified Pseudomonas TaxID=196821 RepID=UPI000D35600D|nr:MULTISPECIES: transporter substrate-binding domain-containing protein [unclassified Pseudomonas]PTS85778.1 amino acid ABC transporter substrate-binding protein [Pseudomonas sp. HMWF032]PTT86076.1 amino acid ABC transporter substrate-binding protein [Pseudomonas sp. HMWF010]WAC45240.1 transporter substrate-binding domain-containing protein [Pseudomonas sp. SL4(2022)]
MRMTALYLMLLLPWSLQAEDWHVVGDEQFAPYSYVTLEDDQPHGLDVELVEAVLQEAKIAYNLRLYPWERVKRMLDRSEVAMAFQFAGTPERMQQYELVGPIRTGSTVFMTTGKTAIHDWQSLDDLSQYVIGQVRGYAYQSDFDKADLRRDTSAQNPRQLVSMLLAGRIDIIVGDRVQLMYFVREQRAEQGVRILHKPLVEMPRYVAFAKGDHARAKVFADALERLKQAGSLNTIYQRWN